VNAPSAGVAPSGLGRIIATCFLPFACGYFLSFLYRNLNAVIGPDLTREIGVDAADLGLLTSTYFAAFALTQLPLGLLLDRVGPRRVESVFLLSAAAGAVVFSLAQSLAGLAVGRALIGLGVSCCLMASIKANSQFWPAERQALANGCLMACGAMGAGAGTLPVEWLLKIMHWRAVFAGLAAITVMVSAYLWLAVPERTTHSGATLRQQLDGVRRVFVSALFWKLVPATVMLQAVYLAYVGLWIAAWLRDVAGLDRDSTATSLFIVACSLVPGFFMSGAIADRLERRGIALRTTFAVFCALFMAVQVPILIDGVIASTALWALFGMLGTTSVLSFALLNRQFPAELTGRASTALNLLIFVMAFALQWGLGLIINHYKLPGGGYAAEGHRMALGVALASECASFLWLIWPQKRPEALRRSS
jgi:predicted MFS family arabinose efflux permease